MCYLVSSTRDSNLNDKYIEIWSGGVALKMKGLQRPNLKSLPGDLGQVRI